MTRIQAVFEKLIEQSIDIFSILQISESEYNDIIKGAKELSIMQANQLVKISNISLDFLSNGKVQTYFDQQVLKYIEQKKNELTLKENKSIVCALLKDAGFNDVDVDFISNSSNDIKINAYLLLRHDNAKLFEFISSKFVMEEYSCGDFNGVLNRGGKNSEGYKDWNTVKDKLSSLMGYSLSDYGFVYFCTKDYNNLIAKFINGGINWNSKAILYLMDCGGVITTIGYDYKTHRESALVDVFQTKLLRDYCERHIDE
ncbi:MAG TPA: hypothetical protein H9731_02280 [Candidatus Borkfalkia excrementipullorum]|nr:hypothetical protein [Candidatus Borkfalkia excrementipullorum]